jgi:hypothetical protein
MAETFGYVPELGDEFLKLFPHRWDFLHAEHVRPGDSPSWQRESDYPLSDRAIQQGGKLYGVSFGAETQYFVLDIDRGSPYHPANDRMAIGRIMDALEPLGITDFVAVTSSYTKGIHLYFPLASEVLSWQLAAVVSQLLKFKGLLIEDGLLEVFPNVRNYDSESGKYSKFRGHRLPLQNGSYLMDDWWQVQLSSSEQFCNQWAFCQRRNEINPVCWEMTLKMATESYHRMGFKGEKFLNDLNTEIAPGWTDHGQTNYLLGRITLRAYVFGHRMEGGEPLKGDRLVREIVRVATQLPGYQDFCRHRHEIYQRAEEWARCVESSKYYPYGSHPSRKQVEPKPKPTFTSWNEYRSARAREKLCFAIARLLDEERFPSGITERVRIFVAEYNFSIETLYHHRDLWHPVYFGIPVENPPDPPTGEEATTGFCSLGANPGSSAKSLLIEKERKPRRDEVLEWFKGWNLDGSDRNLSLEAIYTDFHHRNEVKRE